MDLSCFQDHGLFTGFAESDLQRLAELVAEREYPAGANLCVEDEIANELLFLRSGDVVVTKRDATGNEQTLARLQAPTVVGEVELAGEGPCSATVTAESLVSACVLPCAAFEKAVQQGDIAMVKLLRNLARVLALRLVVANVRYVDMMDWNV